MFRNSDKRLREWGQLNEEEQDQEEGQGFTLLIRPVDQLQDEQRKTEL
jgi:hypothetical protein